MTSAVRKKELSDSDVVYSQLGKQVGYVSVGGAANEQLYKIDANPWWAVPVGSKFHELGQFFSDAKKFDNEQDLDIVSKTNVNPLTVKLRALLDSSMNALNADASPVNAQKILLATLLQATELLEQSVVVSQFPEPANESRKVLVRVYAQLAKILKRNSVDAISKDTSIALEKLFKAQAINPYVAGRGANPQAWVTEEVIPKLDDDMKKAAFNINVYLHSFKRFYMMISDWRSRDKQGLESFFTSK